jgi:hypothetical protein
LPAPVHGNAEKATAGYSHNQLIQCNQLIGFMASKGLDFILFCQPTTKETAMSLINTQVQPFKTTAFVNRGGKGEF